MKSMKEWLENHFDVQQGMYFNEKHVYIGNKYYSSSLISDSVWNYGVVDEFTDDSITAFESLCKKIGKPYNLYVPMQTLNFNDTLLIKRGYSKPCTEDGTIVTETWMSFTSKNYTLKKAFNIKRVSNSKQVDDFVEVFLSAYGGGKTPEKPYGDLPPEYTQALLQSFDNEKFYHFICYNDNNVPVSVASMCFVDGVAGLYNVGTKPEYEKQGYGLAVTDACITQWLKLSGTKLFLQTETGTGIDDWYEKMGFAKIFYGAIYEK